MPFENSRSNDRTCSLTDTDRLDWLERVGDGIAVVHDDHSQWAVAYEGVQYVRLSEGEDFSTSYFVDGSAFRDTLREAIDHAIEEEAGDD